VDPANSKTLYAGARDGLFVSADQGATWTKLRELNEAPRRIWVGGHDVFVGSAHGLFVRRNGKWTECKPPQGVTFTDLSGGFGAGGGFVLYGASEKGAFVSPDGGARWEPVELPGSGAEVRAIATSLHHPEIAYLSYQ